jgi:hypothetical protein
MYKTRALVYIGVFGALWGAVETTIGSVFHTLNVPFSGVLLTAIGIAIALIGRLFVPQRGSVLFIGVVAAFLKMFSIGGIVILPVLGILIESLIAELVVSLRATAIRSTFVLAGSLAAFWPFVHPFLTQGILAGSGIVTIYTRTIQNGARLLGLPASAVLVVLAAVILIHLLVGAVAGLIAWDAGHVIAARLRAPLAAGKAQ